MERIKKYCIECVKRESDHWSARRRAFEEVIEMIDCILHTCACDTSQCKAMRRDTNIDDNGTEQ